MTGAAGPQGICQGEAIMTWQLPTVSARHHEGCARCREGSQHSMHNVCHLLPCAPDVFNVDGLSQRYPVPALALIDGEQHLLRWGLPPMGCHDNHTAMVAKLIRHGPIMHILQHSAR